MFQIRAEQYAALRRKKLGDALIETVANVNVNGRWDERQSSILLEDKLGNRSQVGFDTQGFIDRYTSSLGRTWQFTNLPDGKPSQVVSPSGHKVKMAYTPQGALSAIGSTTKQPIRLNYDDAGQFTGSSFSDGTREIIDYTPWGAPARMVDRLGSETLFTYDEHQRLTGLTDGNGNTTRFVYSKWSRPDSTLYPNGTSEHYTYDEHGLVSGIVQGDISIAVKCNPQGRPLSLRYSDGILVEYAYDDRGNITRAALDDPISGKVVTTISWNERNQPTEETTGDVTHKFTYDEVGQLTGIISGTGESVAYHWDADSRLSGFTDWNGGLHTIEYLSNDRGTITTAPGGVRSETLLAPDGKQQSLSVTFEGKSIYSLQNTYNADAKLASTYDSVSGEKRYTYDLEGRILRTDADASHNSETFTYDRAHNLTSMSGASINVDSSNQVLVAGNEELRYDVRGNLIYRAGSSGTWIYKYNARNQMVSSSEETGMLTRYKYDALGRRLVKQTNEVKTAFIWAGESVVSHVVKDKTSTPSIRHDYLYRPGSFTALVMRTDGVVRCVASSEIGQIRALVSEGGALAFTPESSTFGKTKSSVSVAISETRFPGQFLDEETGFHYNRFRYYAPDLGRYITRDPLSFRAGLNLFSYGSNDPVNKVDPLGLLSWQGVTAVVGGIAAGIAVVMVVAAAAPLVGLAGIGLTLTEIILSGLATGAVEEALNEKLNGRAFNLKCIAQTAVATAAVALLIAGGFSVIGSGLALLGEAGVLTLGGAGVVATEVTSATSVVIKEASAVESGALGRVGKNSLPSFEELMEKVQTIDVSTARDKAVVYFGKEGRLKAEQFAEENGKRTLEMTPGGKWLNGLKLGENDEFGNLPIPNWQYRQLWENLSARYARGASGNVVGFAEGADPSSILNSVEFKELYENKEVTNFIAKFFNNGIESDDSSVLFNLMKGAEK